MGNIQRLTLLPWRVETIYVDKAYIRKVVQAGYQRSKQITCIPVHKQHYA